MPPTHDWDEVHLSTSFPQNNGDAAGHFVLSEALQAARQGRKVLVLAPIRERKLGELYRIDPEYELFIYNFSKSSLFGTPGILTRLRANPLRITGILGSLWGLLKSPVSICRRATVQILICHWWVPSALPLRLVLKRASRTIVVCHGSDVQLLERFPSCLRALIFRSLKNTNTTFRFVSQYLRHVALAWQQPTWLHEQIKNAAVQPSPLELPIELPSGNRTSRKAFARKRIQQFLRENPSTRHLSLAKPKPDGHTHDNDANQQRLILIVARLVLDKRVDTALEALSLVPNAIVFVIGSGPLERSLATKYPFAYFLGQLPRNWTLYFITAADLLLSTSLKEGAPTVIREALLLETPVVARPSGDLKNWARQNQLLELVDSIYPDS